MPSPEAASASCHPPSGEKLSPPLTAEYRPLCTLKFYSGSMILISPHGLFLHIHVCNSSSKQYSHSMIFLILL